MSLSSPNRELGMMPPGAISGPTAQAPGLGAAQPSERPAIEAINQEGVARLGLVMRGGARRFIAGRWFTVSMCAVICLLLSARTAATYSAYEHAWEHIITSAANIQSTVTLTIEQRLKSVDAAVQNAVNLLKRPEFSSLDYATSRLLLMNRADSITYLASLLVIDPKGRIRFDSVSDEPRVTDLSDREFFLAHVDLERGAYLSHPFEGRLGRRELLMSLSRRITLPDGSFGGVVSASVTMNFFTDIVNTLRIGQNDIISIVMDDGTIIFRRSESGGSISNMIVAPHSTALQMLGAEGSSISQSPVDGIERYYVYHRIPGLPLYVLTGIDYTQALSEWRSQAAVGAAIDFLLAASTMFAFVGLRGMLLKSYSTEDKLTVASMTDALTGLYNRRALEEALDRAWSAAERNRQPLSLILLDVDCFKAVNDTYGHSTGDAVLKMIAFQAKASIKRSGDTLARFGGEEFAVLLPNSPANDAFILAEQIRKDVSEARAAPGLTVTLSAGCATVLPWLSLDKDGFLRLADRALYHSKQNGRNRTSTPDMLAVRP